MLMFHDTRMGFPPQYFGFPTPTSCGNPYWTLPQPHWLGPFYPTMTDVIEDVHSLSPISMQSDESTRSSNLSGYRSPESSSTNYTNYYEVLENRSSLDRDRTFASINENKTDSLLAKYQYKSSTPEHQDKLTFECKWKDCDSVFTTMNLLSNHVSASHADINGGLFYCGWEGCSRGQKGFNARYKMLVHVRTHTNEKPHKCNQCDKSFSRAENLKIHTRSHSGEKPYICPVEGCNKAYSNSSDRFKHTRTHSVDKPYFCKIPGCQKRYTDPSSLRKHVKTYKHVELHPNVNSPQLNTAESTPTPTPYNQNRLSADHSNKDHNETNSGDRNTSQYAKDSYETIENRYLSTEHRLHFSENNEKYDLSSRNTSPVCVTNSHLSNVTNLNSEAAHSETLLLYQIEENFIEDGAIAKNNANDDDMLSNLNISRVSEPLNLKRCHESDRMVYENGVLNLQKKLKTENNEYFVKNAFLEMPLDLSLRKMHYS